MSKIIESYIEKGFTFFHTENPEKTTKVHWKKYQKQKPSEKEISAWGKIPYQNYAILCGQPSDIVVFDVDVYKGGDPTLFQNRNMYEVRTARGGLHFYAKYDPLFKTDHGVLLPNVDIQSDGTIVFAPPSKYTTGDVIGEYTIVNDVPIRPLDDDLLVYFATLIEEKNPPKPPAQNYSKQNIPVSEMRPGDIFNYTMTWDELMPYFGFKPVGRQNQMGRQFWCRPGKAYGISASTNYNNYDLLFIYTTHFDELQRLRGYTKFHAYTAMMCGGDFSKAAAELQKNNYKLV